MKLPKIGETITTEIALELCNHFKFFHLVHRIKCNPDKYNEWVFDGCSGIPDELLGLFTGCNWEDVTYKCCLPHDLEYAYGEKGDEFARHCVDLKFISDLEIKAGMKRFLCIAFGSAVHVGGVEEFGLSFSWGFANK